MCVQSSVTTTPHFSVHTYLTHPMLILCKCLNTDRIVVVSSITIYYLHTTASLLENLATSFLFSFSSLPNNKYLSVPNRGVKELGFRR